MLNKLELNKKSAFTLIELVIAVAVLAILVTAAVVALQNITEKAKIAQCKAILKSVRSAILIQKAKNELNKNTQDNWGHYRYNYWPTFEEIRRMSYAENIDSDSVLDNVLPQNPFKAVNPTFTNTFVSNSGTNPPLYDNPDPQGTNPSRNRVWCGNMNKGYACGDPYCPTGWFYDPQTGAFWADSNLHNENLW
jgi:prepilin-type N-terminal cleavage/methylation domain-containing protein